MTNCQFVTFLGHTAHIFCQFLPILSDVCSQLSMYQSNFSWIHKCVCWIFFVLDKQFSQIQFKSKYTKCTWSTNRLESSKSIFFSVHLSYLYLFWHFQLLIQSTCTLQLTETETALCICTILYFTYRKLYKTSNNISGF